MCALYFIRMIGAMPAVAVRHERRRQEKRLKRPSQLYIGGQWLPPLQGSPPTPSPHNNVEPRPELYLCGKVIVFTVSLMKVIFMNTHTHTRHALPYVVEAQSASQLALINK